MFQKFKSVVVLFKILVTLVLSRPFRIKTELTWVIAIITTSMCTNNNIQTLITVQYYELMFNSNNNMVFGGKEVLASLSFSSGLVGCVAPDLMLYGIDSNIGNCTRNANGCSLLCVASVIIHHETSHINCLYLSDRVSSLVSTSA